MSATYIAPRFCADLQKEHRNSDWKPTMQQLKIVRKHAQGCPSKPKANFGFTLLHLQHPPIFLPCVAAIQYKLQEYFLNIKKYYQIRVDVLHKHVLLFLYSKQLYSCNNLAPINE